MGRYCTYRDGTILYLKMGRYCTYRWDDIVFKDRTILYLEMGQYYDAVNSQYNDKSRFGIVELKYN